MADTRKISGHVKLQCRASTSHQWEKVYSVRSDEHGNPNLNDLNYFLKASKVKCPHCGHISYIILEIVVTKVSP